MHPVVESKRAEIAALCRRLWVRTLDVFGSAVGDDFDPERSDVDVLVEVAPEQLTMANYFALRTGLENILGRPAGRSMSSTSAPCAILISRPR